MKLISAILFWLLLFALMGGMIGAIIINLWGERKEKKYKEVDPFDLQQKIKSKD